MSGSSFKPFRKIFEPQSADIIQPLCNTGGIMETKKIAAMAGAYNMRVARTIATAPCLPLHRSRSAHALPIS
jgi:L-alanine-DL-glutamate epimerase-like enolase superfamily enzyme